MKLQSKSETVNPIYLNKVKIPSSFKHYLCNYPDWKVYLQEMLLRVLLGLKTIKIDEILLPIFEFFLKIAL